jgi:phosphatidylglycerol---prolipoprotein diacylglyceryl transferase
MVEATLPFPNIDPVAIHLPWHLGIRWYAISYIVGLMLGWWWLLRTIRDRDLWRKPPFNGKPPATADDIGDFVVWATLGVIIGGRLGWVLFYGIFLCSVTPDQDAYCRGLPMDFLDHPLRIIAAWEGGMSFHGGAIGVIVALWLFARSRKLDFVRLGDLVCTVVPIGLFFGRIANFVNGELWGKPSNVPWAMVFPADARQVPRHPSQLYEAAMEGLLLFIIMQLSIRVFRLHEKPGLLSAIFLTCYGIFRFIAENFREPDTTFIGSFSLGMAFSIPMWVTAAALFWYALKPRHAA